MGKGGRPTKYHDDRCDTILHYLREGNTKRVAYMAARVGKSTFYDWCAQYPEFSDAVDQAEAEAEREHVRNIKVAAPTNWQAAKFWLQARSHGDWRTIEEQRQTGPDGGPIQSVVTVERVDYGKEE
jgi:hypothetical protein